MVGEAEHAPPAMLINACGVGVMEPGGDDIASRTKRAPGLEVPDDDSFRTLVPFLIGGFVVRPAGNLFERPFDEHGEVHGHFSLAMPGIMPWEPMYVKQYTNRRRLYYQYVISVFSAESQSRPSKV